MWFAAILPVAPVHIPPTDGNINKYMPHLKTDNAPHIATFLAQKKYLPCLMERHSCKKKY
jgi:hypothetical protein